MAVNESAVVGSIAVPLCILVLFVVVYFFYYIFFPPIDHLFPPGSSLQQTPSNGYPLSQASLAAARSKGDGFGVSDGWNGQYGEQRPLGAGMRQDGYNDFKVPAELSPKFSVASLPSEVYSPPSTAPLSPTMARSPQAFAGTTQQLQSAPPKPTQAQSYPVSYGTEELTSPTNVRGGLSSFKHFPDTAPNKQPSYKIPPPAPYPTEHLSPASNGLGLGTSPPSGSSDLERLGSMHTTTELTTAATLSPTDSMAGHGGGLQRADSMASSARRGRLPVPPTRAGGSGR